MIVAKAVLITNTHPKQGLITLWSYGLLCLDALIGDSHMTN